MAESANAAPARVKVGRRNFLVDRSFQLKYTLYMVVVGAAISLLFGAFMYKAHVEATEIVDLPDPLREAVQSVDATLLWLVMAIAVVMAVSLGLFGILVTHRVAGPIYVLSHYMNVLGEGRYPALRPLRKNDELKSFFETFHGAVAALKERDRSRGEELKKLAASLTEAAAKAPELKTAADTLNAMADKMLDAAASADPATPGQKAEAASRAA